MSRETAHIEYTGQAYAFRQAGLTMGIMLLLVLTVTVGGPNLRFSDYDSANLYGTGRLDYPFDCH